jgi:hypothetical protein
MRPNHILVEIGMRPNYFLSIRTRPNLLISNRNETESQNWNETKSQNRNETDFFFFKRTAMSACAKRPKKICAQLVYGTFFTFAKGGPKIKKS